MNRFAEIHEDITDYLEECTIFSKSAAYTTEQHVPTAQLSKKTVPWRDAKVQEA